MKYLKQVIDDLREQSNLHSQEIFNYAIPKNWNFFGLSSIRELASNEILVNPYIFYYQSLLNVYTKTKYQRTNKKETARTWLEKSVIYTMDIGVCGAIDHDRDGLVSQDNIYHLADSGTFLKAIHLLGMYQRSGINTLILQNLFELGTSTTNHSYSAKEAVIDFRKIKERYCDPLLTMSAQEQLLAFIDAAHYLGIRVIVDIGLARLSRSNCYLKTHPDWFYWIKQSEEASFKAPICAKLPQNTIPYEYTLKDYYASDEVTAHIKKFRKYAENKKYVVAPFFSDQINANTNVDYDTCLFRFYTDEVYCTADNMRRDLYPGTRKNAELWEMLKELLGYYQDIFNFDGYYFDQTYLLPQELVRELSTLIKNRSEHVALIAQEPSLEKANYWNECGFDAISGNSFYEVADHFEKFKKFVDQVRNLSINVLFGMEAYDSKRIYSCYNGDKLATIYSLFCLFLPNTIPTFLQGIETCEKQPCQLSVYGNQDALYSANQDPLRYGKQLYLDEYVCDYTYNGLFDFMNIIQIGGKYQNKYRIKKSNTNYLPVWFDHQDIRAYGIVYYQKNSALMIICSTNMETGDYINIHLENIKEVCSFNIADIKQVYSSINPHIQTINDFSDNLLSMDFASGEIKLIELLEG